MGEKIQRIRQEVSGVFLILGGVYIALSLVTYSDLDPSPFVSTTLRLRNSGGVVGAYIADILLAGIGFSAFAIPVGLVICGVRKMLGRQGHRVTILGFFLFLISSALLGSLLSSTFRYGFLEKAGGFAGRILSESLTRLLSVPGAYILSLALFLSSLIILSPVSLVSLVSGPAERKKEPEAVPDTETPEEPLIILKTPEERELPLEELPVITGKREEQEVTAPLTRGRLREAAGTVRKGYELPGLELLQFPPGTAVRPSRDELLASASLLEKKLRDFDVEGKVVHVQPGPIVTMYEFEPAPGVKINRIVTLSDDLALSLKAPSVRVSTLPGKAAIGVEVPNRHRETVCLREIIASEQFQKSYSKLTLALGKDISGNPVVADLLKMPHLLVAGATGSGKSVSINSMVMSILYKATPKEVKMLMIDPKLLELSSYEKIPHLISPVITGAKEAAEALKRIVFEMERRYRLLAEKGVRNIEGFNRIVSDEEQLPYIVVFIDELADLMFAAANEVETSIARLAQMARASGIHLILATQRPSVDVITGVIKANFPARISFQVTSRIDSRTIIDTQGAEQLLGKGDMLLMLPGSRIMRIHGALVTEGEIKNIVDLIAVQGTPDYSIFNALPVEEPEQEMSGAERDEMYQKAIDFAEYVGEVSISSIQRRFKIGYNRAARIMELMEEDGLVGPPRGAGKPRDFLRKRR